MREHHATHRMLEEYLRQYDLMPAANDMLWQVNLANTTVRANPVHTGLEVGMKELLKEQRTDKEIRGMEHNLDKCYRALPQKYQDALERAWQDAVEFYGHDVNRPWLEHLRNLDAYFKATGSNEQFRDYRYWHQKSDASDFDKVPEPWASAPVICLHLNREILRYLADLISGKGNQVGGPFMLSATVENCIRGAVRSQSHWRKDFGISVQEANEEKAFTKYLKGLVVDDPETANLILERVKQKGWGNCEHAIRHMWYVWHAYSNTAERRSFPTVTLHENPYSGKVLHPVTGETWGIANETSNGLYHLIFFHGNLGEAYANSWKPPVACSRPGQPWRCVSKAKAGTAMAGLPWRKWKSTHRKWKVNATSSRRWIRILTKVTCSSMT